LSQCDYFVYERTKRVFCSIVIILSKCEQKDYSVPMRLFCSRSKQKDYFVHHHPYKFETTIFPLIKMLNQILEQNPAWRILSKSKLIATLKANKILFSHSELDEYYKKSTLNQIFKRPRPVKEHFRINALPLSFQIDIVKLVQYKSANKGTDQVLLLVDILSRKAFAYILPSGTMADVLELYKTFVKQKCPHIFSVSGDDFFSAKAFVEYNEEKKIKLFTSVAKDNHAACGGNKLGIIDRLVRTLKSLIEKRAMANDNPVWTWYLDERDRWPLQFHSAPVFVF